MPRAERLSASNEPDRDGTDGHGVPALPANTDATWRLLKEVETDPTVSQRALALRLGVSLGAVNQLLRRLVRQRWLRRVPAPGQRVRYVISAEGAAAHERMAREHLESALAHYAAIRDRVRRRLEACAAQPHDRDQSFPAVVLYGVGDMARIAFACAAELGVELVGFVDEDSGDSFLGLPVHAPSALTPMTLAGRSFDWLLVASLADQEMIRGRLADVGFPLDRVSWL